MGASKVIETENLTKIYDGFTAVDHLTFHIDEGEIFGFLGPNGAGKTTTLLMMLGLTEPSSGTIRVFGYDPVREPVHVKRQVGYLQENMGFYRDMNARHMLMFIAELNSIRENAEEKIEEALTRVGLLSNAEKKIDTYSRGMRQRLGLAEILLKEPKIAFLDEPTLGLDPEGTNAMLDQIVSLTREQKMTVLLSSHLLYQVQKVCTRVGIMISGTMVAQGTMEQLGGEKVDVENSEYTLEEIYMKYFREVQQ